MAHARRFRFGAQLTTTPADSAAWVAQARRVEELGYETLFLPDHFGDQPAPFAALAAAAGATSTLRVGSLVFDNDYRHPVVLAKEAATLDFVSGGRLELGVGAGWMTTDYEQSGIEKDSPSVRVGRLEEAVTILKGLFGDGQVDFSGKHYTIAGLDGRPKPVQRPHPPLLIGGGSPRVLRFAGREADIVGINPNMASGAVGADTVADASAANIGRKIDWVRQGAGDRFDDIEMQVLVFAVIVTDDRAGVIKQMAASFGIDDPGDFETPYLWVGSIDQICDDLTRWRDQWGISYWAIQGVQAAEAAAPIVARLAGT